MNKLPSFFQSFLYFVKLKFFFFEMMKMFIYIKYFIFYFLFLFILLVLQGDYYYRELVQNINVKTNKLETIGEIFYILKNVVEG